MGGAWVQLAEVILSLSHTPPHLQTSRVRTSCCRRMEGGVMAESQMLAQALIRPPTSFLSFQPSPAAALGRGQRQGPCSGRSGVSLRGWIKGGGGRVGVSPKGIINPRSLGLHRSLRSSPRPPLLPGPRLLPAHSTHTCTRLPRIRLPRGCSSHSTRACVPGYWARQ